MTRENPEFVRLASRDWLWLGSSIIGAVVAGLILNFSLHIDALSRIDAMDEKWQQRILAITKDVKSEIQNVRDLIPPDWFRQMVENNRASIKSLESEFTKDFVRKDELDQALKPILEAIKNR